MATPTSIFFAYPSRPETLRETISTAAQAIGSLDTIGAANTWEDLKVGGRLVLSEVLGAIDRSSVTVVETTDLNQNVMFELGYAIGSDRIVWLLRDPTDESADRKWRQMRTLMTVGYVEYTNSSQIVARFVDERPDLRPDTIYSSEIAPNLGSPSSHSILYLASLHETDASTGITRRVHQEEERGIRIVTVDPTESSVLPFLWYAQRVHEADVVVVHFESPRRSGAAITNARSAFAAGLARGMDKATLIVAPDDYEAPIDYQDLLYPYPSAQFAVSHVDRWLRAKLEPTYRAIRDERVELGRLSLATELRSLRLGEHVAENEIETLAEYFIDTPAFREVMLPKATIFVGRKGAGKTANFLRAAEELRADRGNLVTVIKPFGYELEAVVRLLRRYSARDEKGYVVESLWKFLLYSEIAIAVATEIVERPAGTAGSAAESRLLAYLDSTEMLTLDFGVRLERTIDDLIGLPETESIADQRTAISETLHASVLRDLRELLAKVLDRRARVALLVDNLDKAWDRSADISELSVFLLGLLTVVEQLENELRYLGGRGRPSVPVSLAVFVRSDIFARVIKVAPEPDKIPATWLRWEDPALLLRVLEERYAAAKEGPSPAAELWDRFFCNEVRGQSTREYLASRVLPRPRDLVYFANAAISTAIGRRHAQVEEDDVLTAEEIYSQFAVEAVEVEDSGEFGDLSDMFFAFAGLPPICGYAEAQERLLDVGIPEDDLGQAFRHLRALGFLGIEVALNDFDFSDDPRGIERADRLAERLARGLGRERRFSVHAAFRPYLEIDEPSEFL
jgi:hypothetical protein